MEPHTALLQFCGPILLGSICAGLFGSLSGLGGGVLLIPMLTLVFHIHIHYAMGASIVSIIATSSGAAAAYVRDRLTNLRAGILLEVATTSGALGGALIASSLSPHFLSLIFGVVLLLSLLPSVARLHEEVPIGVKPDYLANALHLNGTYHDNAIGQDISYVVTRVVPGFLLMGVAGIISGLLGIGAGSFKVLALDLAMRMPMKVSTATSNFMIGVTASASAWIYFKQGFIHPLITAPVALGTMIGAFLGTKVLARMSNRAVRLLCIPVLAWIAIEMIRKGMR